MLPPILKDKLRLPVVASPLFIISHPALTLAQCKAGVVGAFPALNARPESQLDEWLAMITEELAAHDAARFVDDRRHGLNGLGDVLALRPRAAAQREDRAHLDGILSLSLSVAGNDESA